MQTDRGNEAEENVKTVRQTERSTLKDVLLRICVVHVFIPFGGGIAQVSEHVLGVHKVLGSVPSIFPKNK